MEHVISLGEKGHYDSQGHSEHLSRVGHENDCGFWGDASSGAQKGPPGAYPRHTTGYHNGARAFHSDLHDWAHDGGHDERDIERSIEVQRDIENDRDYFGPGRTMGAGVHGAHDLAL